MRESWRLQKNELQEKLSPAAKSMAVFFLYTGKDLPDYGLICQKTGMAIARLCEKINDAV